MKSRIEKEAVSPAMVKVFMLKLNVPRQCFRYKFY